MYVDGIGVTRDAAMGAHHFRRAAELGNSIAQFTLGKMYLEASDLPGDREQARLWLGRAAEQGDSEAKQRLVELGSQAASNPVGSERISQIGPQDAAAQFLLGQRLASGDGVARNEPEAVRWLALAADRGHVPAQYALAQMIDRGRGVPRHLEEVVRLYRAAAASGHTDAQFEIGLLHEHGEGVPRNAAIARAWYRKAARRGHLKALRRLEKRSWWKFW
jgi:TPR repeat protein